MDALFTTYTDAAYLEFLSSLCLLVPAGLILSIGVFFLGWLVAWFCTVVRRIV